MPGRQIPLQPVRVLVRPNLGEPRHGRGRQAAGVRPEQGRQRLGEVARGDALEVEHGDFEALRAPRIRRQERGAEPDAVGALARAVANAWRANRNRADAGHDLAFGQVAVAHQPSAAFFGARLGVAIKEPGNLRLDRPRQQGPGAAAQHLGQRIGKRRWLGKLQNVTCLSMKLSKAAETQRMSHRGFQSLCHIRGPHRATPAYVVVTSSDLDTSRNKASVSGLSWISRKRYCHSRRITPSLEKWRLDHPHDTPP